MQFASNVKVYDFRGSIRNITNFSSAKFAYKVVKVKEQRNTAKMYWKIFGCKVRRLTRISPIAHITKISFLVVQKNVT